LLLRNRPLQDVMSVVEDGIVAVSDVFRGVLQLVDSVARNDCVVLLEGESGTGKELLARRIHQRSPRANGPFIPVNCPAISETLFESHFFGHVKGAFTGASDPTLGAVRAAEGGTLLLDEVGELPIHLQSKLLRLLQEREVIPVGAAKPIRVNTRFIASTNQDLVRRVAAGQFRGDLYHRLNIVRIEVPALRNRPDDTEPLLDYYLEQYAALYDKPLRKLSPFLRSKLREYTWPGNVRELAAYVERLYAADAMASIPQPPLPREDAPGAHDGEHPALRSPVAQPPFDALNLAQAQATMIRQALERTNYNRSAAAKLLSIHRSTLLRKMRFLGLDFTE
jgi:transcriptional regulator with PAS, ATPase and Fis domain